MKFPRNDAVNNLVDTPSPQSAGLDLAALNFSNHPAAEIKAVLCDMYFSNVDPVFKVLHNPSVRAYVLNDEQYLHYESGSLPVTALSFAVYYAAVTTMSEADCAALFKQRKSDAQTQYRLLCETALSQAEYVLTTSLETLQAFVVYLAILRPSDQSRRSWTLIALAVRIAHALGLHTDKSCNDRGHLRYAAT